MTKKTFKARIKAGCTVGQDGSYFTWPVGRQNMGEPEIAHKIFTVEQKDNVYKCVTRGYGLLKGPANYGNGCIYVFREQDLSRL